MAPCGLGGSPRCAIARQRNAYLAILSRDFRTHHKDKLVEANLPVAANAYFVFTLLALAAAAIAIGVLLVRHKVLRQHYHHERDRLQLELREAQREILRHQRHVETFERIARIGSWSSNHASKTIHASKMCLEIYEVPSAGLPFSTEAYVAKFIDDEAERKIAVENMSKLQRGEPIEGVCKIRVAEGKYKHVYIWGEPRLNEHGAIEGSDGVIRDVTDEHIAQTSLALCEERYRMISENMQDIVTLHDPSGEFIYASPSLKRQLGYTLDTASNRLPFDFLHPDDLAGVKLAISQFISDALPSIKIEYRLRKRDGQYAWLETYFKRVVAEDQTLSVFQGLTRDVTERKTAELALADRSSELSATNAMLVLEGARRQELERRVLLSIESALNQVGLELHDDLGQQLTGISLLAKTLENKLTSFPPHAERSTARDAARITELVNRAINHTRMISHGLSPYIGGDFGLAVALSQLASDIDSLGVVSCVARVDNRVQVSDEVAARSLFRIAQEATNNSLKHSGATLIQISLKITGHRLQLTIGDDGSLSEFENSQSRDKGGNALHSIRHRCRSIGARVSYRHFAGVGTFVCVRWPLSANTRHQENQVTADHNPVSAVLQS
jgi:PAS domain S-box-containing protein